MTLSDYLEVLLKITAPVAALGLLFGGIGYGYGKFKEGRTKQSLEGVEKNKEILELLDKQNESLKKLIESKDAENKELYRKSQETINILNKEIGVLTGRLQEKDNKLKEYIEIFQGRNPQLETILGDVSNGLKDIHDFMKKLSEKI